MADGPTTEDIFGNDGVEYSGTDETLETSDSDAEDPEDIYEPSATETDQESTESFYETLVNKKEEWKRFLFEAPRLEVLSVFFMVAAFVSLVTSPITFLREIEIDYRLVASSSVIFISAGFFTMGLHVIRNPQKVVGSSFMSGRYSDKEIESESQAVLRGLLAMGTGLFGLVYTYSKIKEYTGP